MTTAVRPAGVERALTAISTVMRAQYALVSAAMLFAAHPPLAVGPLVGWFCLVPLLMATRGLSWGPAFLLGLLTGVASTLATFFWIFSLPAFTAGRGLIAAAFLGLYPAAWIALVRAYGREGSRGALAFAACAWVMLDFVRDHAGFLALPWATLAQSQVDSTCLVQLASVTGEAGIAFVLVWTNVLLAQAKGLAPRELAVRALPVALAFAVGGALLVFAPAAARAPLPVAVLRTNFPSTGPGRPSPEVRVRESLAALQSSPPAALLVWPESAFVNLAIVPQLASALEATARARSATLVVGEAEALKFEGPPDPHDPVAKVRNGALVISPGQSPVRYTKRRPVPFAEYTPLRGAFEWPRWLVPPRTFEVVAGDGPPAIATGTAGTVAVLVCFESLFSADVRAAAAQGAGVLVHLANEGWFGSPVAGEQHLATLRMRAIETGRPALLSANAGVSAIVDRTGRVVAQTAPRATTAWLTGSIVPGAGATVWMRIGDLAVALAAAGAALLFALRRRWDAAPASRGPGSDPSVPRATTHTSEESR